MKFLSLMVFAIAMAFTQALTFSTIASVSLTLLSLKPVNGFFGMFRRRSSPVLDVIEDSAIPEGPVEFQDSDSDFQKRTNMFGSFGGGNRFFSGFPNVANIPNFPGGMFPPNILRPSWPFAFTNIPRPSQFQPVPPRFQPPSPQSMAQFESQPQTAPEFETGRGERADSQPQINTEEAESFFTLLAETDENKCISRLVCELGAEPEGAGELGSTISEIIGSLTDFPAGSKVSEYNQVLQSGRSRGLPSCLTQFASCDEESYMLMKDSQGAEATGSS